MASLLLRFLGAEESCDDEECQPFLEGKGWEVGRVGGEYSTP